MKNMKNNNSNNIFLILVILIILCCLKFGSTLKNEYVNKQKQKQTNSIQVNEPFKNKANIDYYNNPDMDISILKRNIDDYLLGVKEGGNTNIFELLNIDVENKNPIEVINISLTKKNEIGIVEQKSIVYKKYPIHIILFPYNKKNNNFNFVYLAIFNDGAVYKKEKLKDKNWEGPLRNSYFYNETTKIYVPMRSLSINFDGNLLGIGFDGNIYIKKQNKGTNEPIKIAIEKYKEEELYNKNFEEVYKNDWVKFNTGSLDIINLMLLNEDDMDDKNKNKNKLHYLGITIEGVLNIYTIPKPRNIPESDYKNSKITFNNPIIIENTEPDARLYNISINTDSTLLIINQNRELKKSVDTLKTIIEKSSIGAFDNINNIYKNPNIIYDVIFAYDSRLYGVGSVNNNIVLLKQVNNHFLQPFTKDHNEFLKVVPERFIIKSKSNYILPEDKIKKIKTLEESYDKEVNKDNKKFKQFCRAQFPNNYIDIEMVQKIDEFQQKIKNLETVKNELINLDKITSSIQDTQPLTL